MMSTRALLLIPSQSKTQNKIILYSINTKKNRGKQLLSTEDLILSEIARKRDLKVQEKKKHQLFYSKALKPAPVSSDLNKSKTLFVKTEAVGFNLHTEKRKYKIDKKSLLSPSANMQRKKQMLLKCGRKLTQPLPFNLSERDTTCQTKQQSSEFVSLKTRIDQFFQEETYSAQRSSTKKTLKRTFTERESLDPERVSICSGKDNPLFSSKLSGSAYNPQKLTKPQSPQFKTDKRLALKPQAQTLTTEEQIL